MKKKAVITIKSIQKYSEEDAIEVTTVGEFYKQDDTYYAVYDETELSGMEGTTTTLKISEDSFLLSRVGTTTGDMRFTRGDKDVVNYHTPYGILELKTETKKLEVNLGDNGGEVFIDYNMTVSGQKPQLNMLKINIRA